MSGTVALLVNIFAMYTSNPPTPLRLRRGDANSCLLLQKKEIVYNCKTKRQNTYKKCKLITL